MPNSIPSPARRDAASIAQPGSPYDSPAAAGAAPSSFAHVAAGQTIEGDATGGVIPYKNPSALIAYYLGIFSLFPVVGFPLGIASIVLGFKGLKARRLQPVIKGKAHAIVGIVCGFLGMLFHIPFGLGLIAAIVAAASN